MRKQTNQLYKINKMVVEVVRPEMIRGCCQVVCLALSETVVVL
jgi:hypothetical protein